LIEFLKSQMTNSTKKIFQILVLVILCVFAQVNPVLSQDSEVAVKGDVNGDGRVDISDFAILAADWLGSVAGLE